jgi:glycine betaine catabolism A
MTASPDARLAALLGERRPNRSLPQEFYGDPEIFRIDMERIWGRYWLYAGHACTIPEPGDFLTYKIGDDSVIFVRDKDGGIRAFHNTCRHRGSRLCAVEKGRARHFACPYHGWSYGLDGRLLFDPKAEFGVSRDASGLHPVRFIDAGGLLFFTLSADAPDFSDAAATIARRLAPHGMNRARLAHTIDYTVRANWKIVFENNRECYHCPVAHPEYTVATYDVMRDIANTTGARKAELEAKTAAANARFAAMGLEVGDMSSAMTGAFWRCHRTPLMEGFVSQTLDGKPASTLMGDFKEHDAGTLRVTVFPNFWQHASSDHAVATRLTPIDATTMQVRVMWFVDKDAVEGRDYTLDRLLPLWRLTSEQDWSICEHNQAGVLSSAYTPGPLSQTREQNVAHFIDWYAREVARRPKANGHAPAPVRTAARPRRKPANKAARKKR